MKTDKKRTPWTDEQLKAVVKLYFKFRKWTVKNKPFNIRAECQSLAEQIGKTRGGVEFVMQNVTAILMAHRLFGGNLTKKVMPEAVPGQFKPRTHFNTRLIEITVALAEGEE